MQIWSWFTVFKRPFSWGVYPVTRRQILDSLKLKEFADDNFKFDENVKKVNHTGRKHCGKRRNCSLPAISPFPTVFSKGLFPRGVKRCHCVGMGYNIFYFSPLFLYLAQVAGTLAKILALSSWSEFHCRWARQNEYWDDGAAMFYSAGWTTAEQTVPRWTCSLIPVKKFLSMAHAIKSFTTLSQLLMALERKPFENIVGKGENADNQHFLVFQQCYLPFPKQISIFWSHLFLLSANAFNLDLSKFLSFGKGLIHILKFTTIDSFYIECRVRSGCINMQSDLVP